MDSYVDVKGLDSAELLVQLWKGSFNASYVQNQMIVPPTVETARQALRDTPTEYIDYFNGRVIKINFSTDIIESCGYDRDVGEGAFARVVKEMREKGKNDDPATWSFVVPPPPPPPTSWNQYRGID